MRLLLVVLFLLPLGCGPKPLRGVIQPQPGKYPTHIAGPIPDFGPFPTYSDAVIAACPLVLGMPNAVISSRPSNPNFELYWRLSKEYCAWIYYTPDDRYEMSMLTTSFAQDNPRKRKCRVPPNVHDARYSDESIGHVFVIHNHPVGNELSRDDIQFIVDMGSIHGFTVKTREREVPIGIVAFFSGTDLPTCNGFFLYTPATSEILKWTVSQKSEWKKELYDMVKWLNSSEFEIEYK